MNIRARTGRLLLLVSLLSCHAGLILAQQTISNHAVASLLTCSPGQDLYSIYGHNALRIRDASSGLDWVYNYGTFDFNTPNFYLKFLRGRLDYELSRERFERFMAAYQYEGRRVTEQNLLLDSLQLQSLFARLENNYLPENRAYRYDFFFDNCATRIRDLAGQLCPAPDWQNNLELGSLTYRDLIKQYQQPYPWADFGIDLIIGRRADQIAGPSGSQFIPDFLSSAFVATACSGTSPIAGPGRQILSAQQPASAVLGWYLRPAFVISLFSMLLFVMFWRGRFWAGRVLLLLSGLAGLVMAFMWWGTDPLATEQNWNLLWALPSHLVAAFVGKRHTTFWRIYGRFTAVMSLITLAGWMWWPQPLHPALLPWVGLLACWGLLVKTSVVSVVSPA